MPAQSLWLLKAFASLAVPQELLHSALCNLYSLFLVQHFVVVISIIHLILCYPAQTENALHHVNVMNAACPHARLQEACPAAVIALKNFWRG